MSLSEESDSKLKKIDKQSQSQTDQSNKIDFLSTEVEIKSTEKENLRLVNEQLRICIRKEMQQKDQYTVKANYDSLKNNTDHLKQQLIVDKDKLTQDLDKEKLTNSALHAINNKLVQEVNTHKKTIETLEDNFEKLKQEFETKKTGTCMKNDFFLSLTYNVLRSNDPEVLLLISILVQNVRNIIKNKFIILSKRTNNVFMLIFYII